MTTPFRDAIAAAEERVRRLEDEVAALKTRLAAAQGEAGTEQLRTTRAMAERLRDEVTRLEREIDAVGKR